MTPRASHLSLVLLPLLAACASAPVSTAPTGRCMGPDKPVPAGSSSTAAGGESGAPRAGLAYPKTRTVDVSDTMFGATVRDPYRWLEDEKSPEVQAWVKAQDDLARSELLKLPGRGALEKKLSALSYLESVSVPLERGGRRFYSRKPADKEKRTIYWREGEKGEEHVLLDVATLSPDGSTSLGAWVPSWDGKYVAFIAHPNNADAGQIRIREVATGKDRDSEIIEGGEYAMPLWTPKSDGFYYVGLPTDPKIPAADLPGYSELRHHKLGEKSDKDTVLLPKNGDPETELEAQLSRDGNLMVVNVLHGGNVNGIKFLDLRKKDKTWVDLVKGYEGSQLGFAFKDRIYLRTTEGSPHGRIFVVDPKTPERAKWKEIVPESKDAILENATIVGGKLALTYLRKATSEIEIWTTDGKKVHQIAMPSIGTTFGLFGEPDKDKAYYYFTSYTYPGSIFEASIESGKSSLWYSIKAPVDPAPYEIAQVSYPSKDGTSVSMFVVTRKDGPKDGTTPFILTGYGGFNISQTPSFSPMFYTWLEAGGGVAIPNLRGGSEYGEDWHRGGMLTKKQNVFDDFIGAAEWLIKQGYTKSEKLVAYGGSNGGLLVGAATVQRPELFRAVLCAVPVLDMIRYPQFGDGKTWIAEYGSPKDEPVFKALFAYSPYHNVKPGTAYPSLLMLSADADDRVHPLHAWKTTAALQAAQKGSHPILMRVEKHAGHGGADTVKSRVERNVDILAFAFAEIGQAPKLP